MFRFITVAVLIVTAAGDGLRPRKAIEQQGKRQLLVGGEDANSGYPWFVQFGDNRCGGTLFDPQHVLTSATCVTPSAPRIVWINAKTRNGDDGQAYEYEVECAIKHPDYDQKSRKNDIAVIKLKKRCASELVNLAKDNDNLDDNDVSNMKTFFEIGLGDTSQDGSGSFPAVLQEAEMNLIKDSDCQTFYGDEDLQSGHHVCVNYETSPRGYCSGDGGTPLMDDNKNGAKQYGVATPPINATCNGVENGQYKCGDVKFPDVYADVAFFRSWIDAQVNAGTDACNANVACTESANGFSTTAYSWLNSFLP